METLIRKKIEALLSSLNGSRENSLRENNLREEKKKKRNANFSFKVIQILLGI